MLTYDYYIIHIEANICIDLRSVWSFIQSERVFSKIPSKLLVGVTKCNTPRHCKQFCQFLHLRFFLKKLPS